MDPFSVLGILVGYIAVLYLISYVTSRNASSDSFYAADHKAPWFLVSYGMIGVAISGITFISVPGEVINSDFSYFQIVIGYSIGLLIVALILLPLFYKSSSISIYSFLKARFGKSTHKTGATFFLLGHSLGASFRLFLMAYVLQLIVFDALGVPFWLTVLVIISMIWLYTHKGGIRTVIYTDVFQTTFLLLATIVAIWAITVELHVSFFELNNRIWDSDYSQIFEWSWGSPNNFFKLVLTGMLLTVVSNGLDQAIMQKHLSCSSLRNAQKNIFTLSGILLLVNFLFLFLGGALILFASENNIDIPQQTDQLYPMIATTYLGSIASIGFVIGISAAAYSSADTSLTGLTTSFCVDFLGYHGEKKDKPRVRKMIHMGFSVLIFLLIIAFKYLNNESIISAFIKVSGYVYGPLLGLFTFGILSKRIVNDKWVPLLCALSPLATLILDNNSKQWFGYVLNYETIVICALLTLIGLYFMSYSNRIPTTNEYEGS